MNVNSRIDWHPGMELTAQTFIEFDRNIALKQEYANRIINGNNFGLIPSTPFNNKGVFVKNVLEMDNLCCMAVMPSGGILHIDEKVQVTIPILYGDEYFLGCGITSSVHSFDKETVPFVRPVYSYGIYTLAQIKEKGLFPIMKFKVKEGVFSIDQSYIPPCLLLSSDARFADYVSNISQRVAQLAEHSNLESGEGKRSLLRYAFLLKKYNLNNSVLSLLQMLGEVAQSVEYYIVAPNTENPADIQECSNYDVAIWLDWLEDYLKGASTILDKVVLEDKTIDYQALKEEIISELYQKLYNDKNFIIDAFLFIEKSIFV